MKTESESGRSRGFAYVTFDAPARVRAACERLNGRELPEGSGVRCKVMPALDRERSASNKRASASQSNEEASIVARASSIAGRKARASVFDSA